MYSQKKSATPLWIVKLFCMFYSSLYSQPLPTLVNEVKSVIIVHVCYSIRVYFCNMTSYLYSIDGQDFMGVSATVSIPSLSTIETCINISIIDDDIIEENRLFKVQWTLEDDIPSGVTLDNGVTTVTIADNGTLLFYNYILSVYQHFFVR